MVSKRSVKHPPAATVEHITEDGGLLGIATPDDSQFLIKIGKCDVEHETFFREMDETNSRIHGIFERFTNSWEYNPEFDTCESKKQLQTL